MKKTTLSSAVALCLGTGAANVHALDIAITNMFFAPNDYAAGGSLLGDGTGNMFSLEDFFGNPWTGIQQTLFMDNTGSWAGTSLQGAYDYNAEISAMAADQVAVGVFFNWNVSDEIALLEIFDCAASVGGQPAVCTGNGVPMANGPFAGSIAIFSGTGSDFAPVAVDDPVGTEANTPADFDIVANDTDKDIGGLGAFTIQIPVTSLEGGTLADQGGGVVNYIPPGHLVTGDLDSFIYTVTDEQGNISNQATVNIAIGANEPPVATGGDVEVDEDSSVDLLVDNWGTDADIPPQDLTFVNVSPAINGTVVSINGDTVLTYTPNAEYSGPDSFTYSINDGIVNSPSAGTVNVTVIPVNDAPTCTTASLATDTDTTLVVTGSDLATNCTDKEGDTVTYVSLSATQPTNASLSDDGADTLTIVPNTGFVGDDSFLFNVTDGNVGGEITTDASLKIGTVFSNFTMLDSIDSNGQVFGGTNDILFEWDGLFNTDASDTTVGHMAIETALPQPFFSFFWEATRIRVYEGPADGEPPRHLEFDTACSTAQYEAGTTECGGLKIVMDIPAGHIAGHILFHWGQPDAGSPCGVQNCDIDVVNVWQPDGVWDRHGKTGLFNALWDGAAGVAPDPEGTWEFVTIDSNGDGINGQPMIDGPFQGLYPTYNIAPSGEGEAKPPFVNTQQDTKLDDNVFSMNIAGLLASLMMLLGLRHIGRKK